MRADVTDSDLYEMDNRWHMRLHSADIKKNDIKIMWAFILIYM